MSRNNIFKFLVFSAFFAGAFLAFNTHQAKASSSLDWGTVTQNSALPASKTFQVCNATPSGGENSSWSATAPGSPFSITASSGGETPQGCDTFTASVTSTATVGNFTNTSTVSCSNCASTASNPTPQTVTLHINIVAATPPTASLTVNSVTSVTVNPGATLNYAWSSTNATSSTSNVSWTGTCSGAPSSASPWGDIPANSLNGTAGPDTVQSSQAGCTYTVNYIVTGPGGSATATIHIIVNTPPVACSVSLSANPSSGYQGMSSTLSWTSSNGSSMSITGSNNAATYSFNVGSTASGSTNVGPLNSVGTYTYTLTCTGPDSAQHTSVVNISVSTPPPSCSIISFTANPTSVTSGNSSSLAWSTSNCTSATLSGGTFTGGSVGTSSAGTSTGALSSTTTYTLSATDGTNSPTATVTVTVTAPPSSCVINSFTASPTSVSSGSASVLSWSTSNCTSATLSGGAFGAGTSEPVNSSGISTGALSSSTTYTFSATNGTQSPSSQATVTVTSACAINSFTASPTTVSSGSASTLAWSTSNCTSATLSGGAFGAGTSEPVNSAGISSGGISSSTTYTLSATNGSNTPTQSVTVSVSSPSCTINSFTANPTTVSSGGGSTLSWTTSNCTSVTLNGGIYNNASEPTSGSAGTGGLTVTTSYILNASNANGSASPAGVTVNVSNVGSGACTRNITSTTNGVSGWPEGMYLQWTGPTTYTVSNTGSYSEPLGTYTFQGSGSNPQSWNYSGTISSWNSSPSGYGYNIGGFNINCNSSSAVTINEAWSWTLQSTSGATAAANACGSGITVTWTGNGSTTTAAGNFKIWRNTVNDFSTATVVGTKSYPTTAQNNTGTYTDSTAASGTTYYYWVQPYDFVNGNTLITAATAPTGAVTATSCVADFRISDAVVTKITPSGTSTAKNYGYSSSCIGTQTNQVSQISSGDTASFSVDICNAATATYAGQNVTPTLTLTNLSNPRNFKLNGTAISPSISGNTITFANLGSVAASGKDLITFDATVATSTGLNTFRVQGSFTYTTAGSGSPDACYGTSGTCALDTGPQAFSGSSQPSVKEINP